MPRMLVDRIDRSSVLGMSLSPKQKMLGRGATSVVFDHPADPNLVIVFSLDDFKFQWLMHLGLCLDYEWNATGFFNTKTDYARQKPKRLSMDIHVGIVKRMTRLAIGTAPYRLAMRERKAADKLWFGMVRPAYPQKWTHTQENWEFWTRILDAGEKVWPTLFPLADYIINLNGSDIHPDMSTQNWMLDGDQLIAADAAISQFVLDFIWK